MAEGSSFLYPFIHAVYLPSLCTVPSTGEAAISNTGAVFSLGSYNLEEEKN
jgi:hypothetical protein